MRDNSPFQALSLRALSWVIGFLVISAGYLYSFPQPNIFYAVVVLLHAIGGVFATILLIPMLFRLLRQGSWSARVRWGLNSVEGASVIILLTTRTPQPAWNQFYTHLVISFAGVGFLIADRVGTRASSLVPSASRAVLCLAL